MTATTHAGLWSSLDERSGSRQNHPLDTANGTTIPDHTLTLRHSFLMLDVDGPVWTDTIELTNYGQHSIRVPLTLSLRIRFESMFNLRGAPPGRRGTLHRPTWEDGTLRFAYDGADAVRHTLLVSFSLPTTVVPRTRESSTAHFDLSLQPLETVTLVTTLRVDERRFDDTPVAARPPVVDAALGWLDRKTAENEAGYVTCDGIADDQGQPINQSWRDSGTGVLLVAHAAVRRICLQRRCRTRHRHNAQALLANQSIRHDPLRQP